MKLLHFPTALVQVPLLAVLIAALLSGCGGGAPSLDASAQAWVEYPYDGSILPLGPLTLVVYAADSAGISYIHIKVNGQSLPAYAAAPMTVDGSSRLVRIDYWWTPPAEGEYLVEAAGVNAAGVSGTFGSTRFCIVTCAPAPAPTDTPVPAPTDTPAPFITLPPLSPTPTWTLPAPPPVPVVTFFGDPSSVNAGNCYTLHWDVSGSDQVYLNGSYVYAHGMEERCPCETENHTLRVTAPDGSTQDYYARIEVYGSCYVPPTETSIPPGDTNGPSIDGSVFWEGCSLYGQASITDPAGLSYAEFWYNLNDGGWVSIPMSDYGGNWQSQSGVGTGGFAGRLQYKFHAVDAYGNESWSSVGTYNFSYCGG